MIEGSLGMIIEGLVSVLLVATIFYCISVNRKLERLRHEQKSMYSFIKELSLATANADKAILGLRTTVQHSGAELAEQIEKSGSMSRLLQGEIEGAEQAMSKLVVLTGRATHVVKDQNPVPGIHQHQHPSMSTGDLRPTMPGFDDVDMGSITTKAPPAQEQLVATREIVR